MGFHPDAESGFQDHTVPGYVFMDKLAKSGGSRSVASSLHLSEGRSTVKPELLLSFLEVKTWVIQGVVLPFPSRFFS